MHHNLLWPMAKLCYEDMERVVCTVARVCNLKILGAHMRTGAKNSLQHLQLLVYFQSFVVSTVCHQALPLVQFSAHHVH